MKNTRVTTFYNGWLPLTLGWRGLWQNLVVIGGPYANFPGDAFFGVCLREQQPEDCDVWLPIHDFSVPESEEDVIEAIKAVVEASISGEPVYVGCMGGWGRTGLFLSLLAKAAGVDEPVSYVRKMYTPKAVETKEQEQYVADFDMAWFNPWLLSLTKKRVWHNLKGEWQRSRARY